MLFDFFCWLKVLSDADVVRLRVVMPPRIRVADRSLNIKRPPHAFAFYLADMKSRCRMRRRGAPEAEDNGMAHGPIVGEVQAA